MYKNTWAVDPTWNVRLSPVSEDKGQYNTCRGGLGDDISACGDTNRHEALLPSEESPKQHVRFSTQLYIRGSQLSYQPTTFPISTQHGPHPQKGTERLKEGCSRGQQSARFAGGKRQSPRKTFSSIYVLKLLRSLPKPHKTCKVRPIKVYRTLPRETSCQKVCLSSRPSGGHSQVVTRVCGGW